MKINRIVFNVMIYVHNVNRFYRVIDINILKMKITNVINAVMKENL
jgi:hypothetical protein